jgi:hypothetical protein
VPSAFSRAQSASLPGRRSLRVAVLRGVSFCSRRRMRSSARSTTKARRLSAVVEVVAQHRFDQALRLERGQLLLGLALEMRLADEDREHAGHLAEHVLGGDVRGAPVLLELAIGAQGLDEGVAQPGLVRAALGRGDGVGVGVEEALALFEPG